MKNLKRIFIVFLISIFFVNFSFENKTNESVKFDDNAKCDMDECIQEDEVSTQSLDSNDSCIDFCNTHGPGRSAGGESLLQNGCRNYMSFNFSYGSKDVPYWINMDSFDKISNKLNKNKIIADIRTQVTMWNNTRLCDGSSDYLVNFYEVGVGSHTRPADINGKKVLEFNQGDLRNLKKDSEVVGVFYPSTISISLSYDNVNDEILYNVDTIVHELGHFLSLNDIDFVTKQDDGTHKTLMGYGRDTNSNTLYKAIKYTDIQGVAVMNGSHSKHSYYRYVKDGNDFFNICYYCDKIDKESSPIDDSQPIESNSNCNHDYYVIASSGIVSWSRCKKCYKVTQSELKNLDSCYKNGVYEIWNQDLLNQIQTQPNGGLGRTYKLMADIYGEPAERAVIFPSISVFKGTLDGNNHSISHFEILTNTTGNYGLCGINEGTIKNLILGVRFDVYKDANNINVGCFAGINRGTIDNCTTIAIYNRPYCNCYATGDSYAGYFVGINEGSILNCYGGDLIFGSCNIGTVAGKNSGIIDNCSIGWSAHEVNFSYNDYNACVGGIVGIQTDGRITNCYFRGNVVWSSNYTSSQYPDPTQNREMQPCIGIIVGRKQGGYLSENTWMHGTKATNDVVTATWSPTVVTWETGWWLWKETHTNNQALYFKNEECGRTD